MSKCEEILVNFDDLAPIQCFSPVGLLYTVLQF